MGLDSEAMKGSFTAIEQMMNKQQIYAEELKTQLGERFPAAISMMAEAVSRKEGKLVTVPELMALMKEGKVDSSVLKEFAQIASERARKGGALDTAKQSSAAQQGRFNNAWSLLVEKFSEAGFDKLMQEFWKSAAEGLEMLSKGAKGLAQVFELLMRPVLAFINILKGLAPMTDGLNPKLVALVAVVAALVFPFTSAAAGIALLVMGIEDLMVWAKGGDSLFGKLFEGLKPEQQAQVLSTIGSLKLAFQGLADVASVVKDGWTELFKVMTDDSMLSGVLETVQTIAEIVSVSVAGLSGLIGLAKGKSLNEVADDINSRMSALQNVRDKRESLTSGLDLLSSAGMNYSGNKITSVPQDQANPNGPRVKVDINLTADQITKMMGDGTFGTFMTEHTERGVKEWMAKELGGAGARLVDYD
jgi:tape measure domain-containing protein